MSKPNNHGCHKVFRSISKVESYIEKKKIPQLLYFLLVQIFINAPDHPREFLVDLMHKLIAFREKKCAAPVIFSQRHLEAVFSVMDREQIGAIPLRHYRTAMEMLGVEDYDPSPPRTPDGLVLAETFVYEASRCLVASLRTMVGLASSSTVENV